MFYLSSWMPLMKILNWLSTIDWFSIVSQRTIVHIYLVHSWSLFNIHIWNCSMKSIVVYRLSTDFNRWMFIEIIIMSNRHNSCHFFSLSMTISSRNHSSFDTMINVRRLNVMLVPWIPVSVYQLSFFTIDSHLLSRFCAVNLVAAKSTNKHARHRHVVYWHDIE
jgi:hypothetical protein